MTGLIVGKGFQMTDMAQGEVQSSSTLSPAPLETTYAPQSAHVERTFKQSEVNDLIGRTKHEAVERYKREASMNAPQVQNHAPQPSYQPQNTSSQTDQIEHMRKIASEESERTLNARFQDFQRVEQEKSARAVADTFFAKVDQAKTKYNDFDSVMQGVNYGTIPNTVAFITNFDNTEDMLYELGKNPLGLANLERAAGEHPELAMAELRRLSQTIKNNQQASQFKSPNEPLSQMRPTKAGAEKSGPLTASDYRRKYRV